MKKRRSWLGIALAFVVLLPLSSPVFAGPWTKEEGTGYVGLSMVWTHFSKVSLFNSTEKSIGDVNFYSQGLYFEYGLQDKLTVQASVPFEYATRTNNIAIKGIGDGRLGLKFRLLDEADAAPLTLSVGAEFKLPLSDYGTKTLQAIGDGQQDLEIRFMGARFLQAGEITHYLSLEGGFRWRKDGPANENLAHVEFGSFWTDRLSTRIFLSQTNSRGGVGLESPEFHTLRIAAGAPPFPQVQEDFVKVGAGLSVLLTSRVDLVFFWSQMIDQNNTSIDRHFGLGIGISY